MTRPQRHPETQRPIGRCGGCHAEDRKGEPARVHSDPNTSDAAFMAGANAEAGSSGCRHAPDSALWR
jgi:hypothetical protein